jgi:hypothetical protein
MTEHKHVETTLRNDGYTLRRLVPADHVYGWNTKCNPHRYISVYVTGLVVCKALMHGTTSVVYLTSQLKDFDKTYKEFSEHCELLETTELFSSHDRT